MFAFHLDLPPVPVRWIAGFPVVSKVAANTLPAAPSPRAFWTSVAPLKLLVEDSDYYKTRLVDYHGGGNIPSSSAKCQARPDR